MSAFTALCLKADRSLHSQSRIIRSGLSTVSARDAQPWNSMVPVLAVSQPSISR